jgi:hypothetical protein
MPGRTGIRVLEGTIDERQRTDAVTIHFKDAPTHARPATQMNSGDSNQEQVATLSLRRSLIRLASIGVVIAGMVGLFAYAGGWLSPHILSPAPMIDTLRHRLLREQWARCRAVQGSGLPCRSETRDMTAKSALFIPASLLAATLALALPALNIEISATEQSRPTATTVDDTVSSYPRGGTAGVGP